MLTRIAQRLVNYVLADENDNDLRAVYEYGCELWLYTILSTVALLTVGAVFHALMETAWMIIIFYACQSTGGGYHAKTHTRCFLTMLAGLLAGLLFIAVPFPHFVYLIAACVAASILWTYPLYLHPNKQYLANQRKVLIRKSRYITAGCLLVTALLNFVGYINMVHAGCTALALTALSRLYALANAHQK